MCWRYPAHGVGQRHAQPLRGVHGNPFTQPRPAPHQIVTGADVAVLERFQAPTTGETWHEPREIENLGLFAHPEFGMADTYRYFEVGSQGGARLVVATSEYSDLYMGGNAVYAMFAVSESSAAMLTCPSARGGDGCLDWSTDWERPGRYLEPNLVLDSLTYPERVEPLPGWSLQTSRLAATTYATSVQAYGDANEFPSIATTPEECDFLGRDDRIVLTALGDSTLVEYRQMGDVPGLADSRFAIETPFDSVIASESALSAAYYGQGAITWNDGVDTFTHDAQYSGAGDEAYPVTSASYACSGPDETRAATFDSTQWQVAGKHRLGFDVYLPVTGGNDTARAVWQTLSDLVGRGVRAATRLSLRYVRRVPGRPFRVRVGAPRRGMGDRDRWLRGTARLRVHLSRADAMLMFHD
jgi:hypothetical protein